MSRIGKQPIIILDGVIVSLENQIINVKGQKGELALPIPRSIGVSIYDNKIVLRRLNTYKKTKQLHGLYRSLINNMILGVSEGYSKRLIVQGVGYRSQVNNTKLTLNIGYSHPVIIQVPLGITVKSENNTEIIISGTNKAIVGETAAKIRAIKAPEPYKGKGIRYQQESIKKKVGKTGK